MDEMTPEKLRLLGPKVCYETRSVPTGTRLANDIYAAVSIWEADIARIEALEKALWKYGRHTPSCSYHEAQTIEEANAAECSCGFAHSALAAEEEANG